MTKTKPLEQKAEEKAKDDLMPVNMPNNISQAVESINASGLLGGLKVGIANPKTLKLLDKNARFMENYQYQQLLDNVKRDGHLASTPFCHLTESGEYLVLSGNHRVKAAIDAGIDTILFIYRDTPISQSEKLAIQLSHNALVGKDDKQILASLWQEIESIEAKLYSGLDSALIEELEKINFAALSTPRIAMESISLLFLPEEVEKLEGIFESAKFNVQAKTHYLCSLDGYDNLFNMLVDTKKKHNIKNTAVAFLKVLDWAEKGREMEAIEEAKEHEATAGIL